MDKQQKGLYDNLVEIGRTSEAEEMLEKYGEYEDEIPKEDNKEVKAKVVVKKHGKKSKR